MTDDIIVADDLPASSLTVAQAVLTDDAEMVFASTEDTGNYTLSEWSE